MGVELMPEKACSICKKIGVPLKQLNIPMPPWHLFYCKACWEHYVGIIRGAAEKKKAAGKGREQTAKEIVDEMAGKK
jgi:hypothetical protein